MVDSRLDPALCGIRTTNTGQDRRAMSGKSAAFSLQARLPCRHIPVVTLANDLGLRPRRSTVDRRVSTRCRSYGIWEGG